ncbi:oxidoreductase [Erythrobacter sp. KY5]|uniref:NAD(P)-dependent oxidoreductase n=1 Tax=Erythrobacter sp. KY5 TaxID=2011159 RepID=UPI000DBF2D88|nr:NAD(P)-dependent oxidoreductase [Erythrobacter sp. KY5]AWW73961.1 oxidoreductase [Erythrobacter sp. KY5]
MTASKRIAFLGLGVMGGPMWGHLVRAGHEATGYNRGFAKAEEWSDRLGDEGLHAPVESDAATAVKDKDVVLACLGNDDDVASVLFGASGVLAAMKRGATFVDHTTVSPGLARRIADECDRMGLHAVDAPVSGGQAGAENGKLSIMCGGSDEAMALAEPVMQAYAARIVHIGGAGAGQTAKAINQVCIAGVLAGLSEGVRLAQATGVDTGKVLEAISGGAAQSWQMENRWPTMVKDEFDFGFAIDWMRKDLAIALEEAAKHEFDLPVTTLVDQFYSEVQAAGGNRLDTSALVTRYPKSSDTK